jgi:hypothetical protein
MKIDGAVNSNLLVLFLHYGCEMWIVISVSRQSLWILILIQDYDFNFSCWAAPFNALLNWAGLFTNLMGTWNLTGLDLKFHLWVQVRVWFFSLINFIVGWIFAPPDPMPSLARMLNERDSCWRNWLAATRFMIQTDWHSGQRNNAGWGLPSVSWRGRV